MTSVRTVNSTTEGTSTGTQPFSGTSRRLRETNQHGTWLDRLFNPRRSQTTYQLEEVVDATQNLEVHSLSQIQGLNPRRLYRVGLFSFNPSLYNYTREQALSIPDGVTETFTLMTQESAEQLRQRSHEYIHFGLLTIGVRGLTRSGLGTKVLLVLYDDRIKTSTQDATIGSMEVDMNNNFGIIWIAPKMFMKITDFVKHIKILAQAKGYKGFQGHNILLDIVFIGKTMNNLNVTYKIDIGPIIANAQTKGVQFIKPLVKDPKTLAGLEWTYNLIDTEDPSTLVPTEAITYEDRQGKIHQRFANYDPLNIIDPLEEEIEEEQ